MDFLSELRTLVEKFSQVREDNLTRREFLDRENISLSALKKLKKLGLAPKFTKLPGLALERLSKENYADWRRRMAEAATAEAETSEQKVKERRARKQRREAARRGGRPKKAR